MMKKTHMVVGVTLSSVVALNTGMQLTPVFLVASAIGAIMPDGDHPSGAINQKLLLFNNAWFKALFYSALAVILVFYGTKEMDYNLIMFTVPICLALGFSRHRSVTHSFLGLVGVVILMKFIKITYGLDLILPFGVGYASHILIDMLNPQGVELLWPYDRNFKFPLINIDTGGAFEKLGLYVFLAISLYFIGTHYNMNLGLISDLLGKLL